MTPHPASPRSVSAALVVAMTGLTLAACSSPHPSTSSTTGTSGTAPTTTSSTTTSTPGASTTGCGAGALSAAVLGSQGAAGTFEVTFRLRNGSTAACTMDGFAGALLLDASGAPLPTNVVRAGSYSFTNFASSVVTLAPGATAYFNLGYSDVTVGGETSCEMATALQVIPPGTSTRLVVSSALSVCNHGTVTVSPIFGAASPQLETTAPPHT
jgi:Protein of unknown function (DUF4232)